VRGYRARRAARQREALARGRLRAVAVDGKTSRGALCVPRISSTALTSRVAFPAVRP
jgi:hypothetical protein